MSKTTPEEAYKLAEAFGFTLFGNEYQSLAALIDEVRGVDAKPYAYEWLTPNTNGTWCANFGFAPPKHGVGYKNVKALYTHPAPSQPAAPVELPVVAELVQSKHHYPQCKDCVHAYYPAADDCGWGCDGKNMFVKLSDAQAAIAAGRKAS